MVVTRDALLVVLGGRGPGMRDVRGDASLLAVFYKQAKLVVAFHS